MVDQHNSQKPQATKERVKKPQWLRVSYLRAKNTRVFEVWWINTSYTPFANLAIVPTWGNAGVKGLQRL